MAEHTYRVTVRGRFADLTDDQRASLREHLEGFDFLRDGGFSEEGGLTFDEKLDFFSYRVILTAKDKPDEAGLRRATTALDALGVDFKGLRAKVTDMDEMKINRPKRLG
ncbi:hypothetical protein UK23_28915 [Lentzea aerocolonigenes]|uniref:Uncharacterized protein n=1 Tax=Lentzea aerocolonigenes TaxID=68170 RepID=A0A0F0GRK4_LENAE|nr:DUF6204 family protein [Lentzea aerocolonigenes]KJK44592.1 hypothetical protein UK23_28915 [Lentzea aerocolonigenes]